jgi:5-methylcytosine-specific restriction endonuclease McrA
MGQDRRASAESITLKRHFTPSTRKVKMTSRRLVSKKLRQALYLSTGGKCAICGVDLPDDWHADHVIPWSVTGRTNVHEMQPLCPPCNLRKGAQA